MYGILLIQESKDLGKTTKTYLHYPDNSIILLGSLELAKKLCENTNILAAYDNTLFKVSYKVVDYTTGMFVD